MGSLANKVRSLIRWAVVTAAGLDTETFPVQHCAYMGKDATGVTWFPYGYHANMLAGAPTVMAAIQGLPEDRVLFGGSPFHRGATVGPLREGEVMMYQPGTSARLHFQEGGDIEMRTDEAGAMMALQSQGDVAIAANDELLVTGFTKATLWGWQSVLIVTGGTITMGCNVLDINNTGLADIQGAATVNGTLTAAAVFMVNGDNFMNHTHGSGPPVDP